LINNQILSVAGNPAPGASAMATQIVLSADQVRQLGVKAGDTLAASILMGARGPQIKVGNSVLNVVSAGALAPGNVAAVVVDGNAGLVLKLLPAAGTGEQVNAKPAFPALQLSAQQLAALGLQPGQRLQGAVSTVENGVLLSVGKARVLLTPQQPVPQGTHTFRVNPDYSLQLKAAPTVVPAAQVQPPSAGQGGGAQSLLRMTPVDAATLGLQGGSEIRALVSTAPRVHVLAVAGQRLVVPQVPNQAQGAVDLSVSMVEPRGSAKPLFSLGGSMINSEPLNMAPRANIVYVEGGAAGVRIQPEQARVLGLREGETINAIVAQRRDGNVLLVGNQQLAMPTRLNLPQGPIAMMVSMVKGQLMLSPVQGAGSALSAQRVEADARFARLLTHVGTFHLSQLLSPGTLSSLAQQNGAPALATNLAGLLLRSDQLSAAAVRRGLEQMGLFTESQAAGRTLGGTEQNNSIKSILLALRSLMQARQAETTQLSGAIDELEARQLDSLAQQGAGRQAYSWVLPFADQLPVFLELNREPGDGSDPDADGGAWSVDMEVGLDQDMALSANVRVDASAAVGVRLWLPHPALYQAAEQHLSRLDQELSSAGLNNVNIRLFPAARRAGSVSMEPSSVGVRVDA
tara:strand:+ start:8250 stop:10139 length:1890 start_codon:yes stop_codon:yes gene_type:complete